MIPPTTTLMGFRGEISWPLGQISLLVSIGDREHSASAWMNFMQGHTSEMLNGHEILILTYPRNPNRRDKGYQDINPPRIPGSDNHHRKGKDGTP
ncbi:hypothetical protein Tco_0661788 [Tanacetum coccineum]